MNRIIHFLLPFLTGFLLYASFHPINIPVFAWICLVPLLIFIVREPSWWKVALFSYLAGYAFFAVSFSWINFVLPIGSLLIAIYFAFYFVAFALAIKLFAVKKKISIVLITPVIWVILEYIRCYLLTGLPWFYLAHTQYLFHSIIQISDITGVWGVSFLIGCVNGYITHIILFISEVGAQHLKKNTEFKYGGIILIILILSSLLYGTFRTKNLDIKDGKVVAVVQGNIPQEIKELVKEKGIEELEEERQKIYQKHIDLTRKIQKSPDLVVWSEASMPYPILYDEGRKSYIGMPGYQGYDKILSISQSLRNFLVGCQVGILPEGWYENNTHPSWYNSAIFATRDKIIDRYDKVHLVPFGEYIPLRKSLPIIDDIIKTLSHMNYIPDMASGCVFKVFDINDTKFGVVICFEILFSDILRELKQKGADSIVNISNDGWFKDSAELEQILAISVFRAIENRMTIVRATNTGISAFISPDGQIYHLLADSNGKTKEIEGVLEGCIKTCNATSIYNKIGDIFIYLLCLLLIVAFIIPRK